MNQFGTMQTVEIKKNHQNFPVGHIYSLLKLSVHNSHVLLASTFLMPKEDNKGLTRIERMA